MPNWEYLVVPLKEAAGLKRPHRLAGGVAQASGRLGSDPRARRVRRDDLDSSGQDGDLCGHPCHMAIQDALGTGYGSAVRVIS